VSLIVGVREEEARGAAAAEGGGHRVPAGRHQEVQAEGTAFIMRDKYYGCISGSQPYLNNVTMTLQNISLSFSPKVCKYVYGEK